MWKKVIGISLLVLALLCLIYWDMLTYGIGQAKGQLHIIQQSRPNEEVLEDEVVPDSIKAKIRLIQSVKLFASEQIGLATTENYTSYYDQKGTTALWNLSACKPYAFEPYQWTFPFLGSFPYKGFFELDKAKEEAEILKAEGYDVRIRPVGGWSTLGWTKDPILSNMLERSEGAIAELIIHELTHATLFVKDDINFNENLASFIGEQGALLFLENGYGTNSPEMIEYVQSEADGKRFRKHMLMTASMLDSLFQAFSSDPDSIKELKKHIMVDQIVSSLDTITFYDSRYNKVFQQSRPNNAYFMSYFRYYSSGDSLTTLFIDRHNQNLKAFVAAMKAFHED